MTGQLCLFKKMVSSKTLKNAILDLKEPVIFQGFEKDVPGDKNPEFLRWNINTFLDIFDDASLPFRTGDNARTPEPQWDIKCPIEHMTISQFIEKMESIGESELTDNGELRLHSIAPKWYYFDYKYMHQWFKDRPGILESVNWQRFGFDKKGHDSTMWIGSPRAHTNCHQDSYGCNLVAQIKGRKQWLLFPPDSGDSMRPTRVPYEESTVYSKFNFFCPTVEDECAILKIATTPRLVTLEPGQVLLVPNGWWHYVESLDFSISINVWLPIKEDHKARLKEALVQMLVSTIGEEIPFAPENEPKNTREESINLIKTCIDEYKKHSKSLSGPSIAKQARRTPWTAAYLAMRYPNSVKLVPEYSTENLHHFLISKRIRFSGVASQDRDEKPKDSTFKRSVENVVNAMCHSDVIDKVSDLLLDAN